MAVNYIWATGRRKCAVARVRIKKGSGKFEVNGKPIKDYFKRKLHTSIVIQPLEVTDSAAKFDIAVNVTGGGDTGQAGAIRHGLSRALCTADPNNRPSLKKNGFLTRDPRMVERKKYGKHGARKSTQFSKR